MAAEILNFILSWLFYMCLLLKTHITFLWDAVANECIMMDSELQSGRDMLPTTCKFLLWKILPAIIFLVVRNPWSEGIKWGS